MVWHDAAVPVYTVDKPLHLTSHDVVSRARRILHTRRVGHTGTLDPLATGVLVLCVDDSTKLVQFMEHDRKEYLAWISLGAATPTLDAEGPISERSEVGILDKATLQDVLARFVGAQQQTPPQYSALQVGGVRAYDVARAGGQIALAQREIMVHELELLGYYPRLQDAPTTFDTMQGRWAIGAELPSDFRFTLPQPLGDFPTLLVRAQVGSGTYIRSLARDIGAALGLGAHLAGLVRTRVGPFDLASACTLETLAQATPLPDLTALQLPKLEVDATLALQLRQGKRPAHTLNGRAAITHEGRLVAVVDGNGKHLKVVRVWPQNADR